MTDPMPSKVGGVFRKIQGPPGSFTFFELKVNSNTPLYAAVEILQYGLLLAWSKANREELGYRIDSQPAVGATHVTLSVLAPPRYYYGFDLSRFEAALNEGLREFRSGRSVVFDFEFSQFSADIDGNMDAQEIRTALNRSSVWPASNRRQAP